MRRSVRALRSAFAMQITGPSWRAPIRPPLWIAPGRALRPSGSNEGPCARLLLFTPPVLAHQRLLHSRWHGLVVRQRNGVAALAAGHRMQQRLVVGQLDLGHLAADGHGTAALAGGAGDEAAPRRQVAPDIAHRMLGHGDLDLHDRFEHGRTGLADRGHKGLATGGREGDVLAVDAVVLAVVHHDAPVDHGGAGDPAVGHPPPHPFSTGGRNRPGVPPPLASAVNAKPAPAGSGSMRRKTSANWPAPPLCFLWRWGPSGGAGTGSREAMGGGRVRTSKWYT